VSQTVEVRFKGTRKAYFLWSGEEGLRVGEAVVVEAERGRDLGRVTAVGDLAEKKCGGGCSGCAVGGESAEPEPLKQVISRATDDDLKSHSEIRRSEEDARRKVVQRVRAHDLVMKVSDTEWQWDRNKLTIYFTAEKRVDFRALVRDLASTFRTRIELRQIGVLASGVIPNAGKFGSRPVRSCATLAAFKSSTRNLLYKPFHTLFSMM
jgi:cell fate regulator YaaT (PSP1 superfamily)